MLANRPYALASRPACSEPDSDFLEDLDDVLDEPEGPVILPFVRLPRLAPAPCCDSCDGLGFRRFFDADAGHLHEPCLSCLGRSTAGAFVVQIVAEDFRHELSSFHTHDLAAGLDKLASLATQLAGRRCLGRAILEARLVFTHHDSHWRSPEGAASEVVAVVRIARPAGKRA